MGEGLHLHESNRLDKQQQHPTGVGAAYHEVGYAFWVSHDRLLVGLWRWPLPSERGLWIAYFFFLFLSSAGASWPR